MEPCSTSIVTSSCDELGLTAPDVAVLSIHVTQESSLSLSASQPLGRRWSIPDDCGTTRDPVEHYCHSADVLPRQLSDWETVQSGAINLHPSTHLIYSGVHSHASPQHNVLQVFT